MTEENSKQIGSNTTDGEQLNMKPLDTTNKMLSPSLVYNVDVGKITNRYEYGPDTNKKSMFGSVNSSIQSFSDEYSTCLRIGKHLLAHFLVLAYFIWATVYFFKHKVHDTKCENVFCDGYGMLFLIFLITYGFLFYFKIGKPFFGPSFSKTFTYVKWQLSDFFRETRYLKYISTIFILAIFIGLIVFDTYSSPHRLRSLLGIFVLLGIGFIFSKHRSQIKWRPVITGTIFQFLLGIFCIRIDLGRNIFQCLGDKAAAFFGFAKEGATFIYGKDLVTNFQVFAFASLPVIFFFSFFVSILYFYGIMQWTIKKCGCMLQMLIGTTLIESVTVAANIVLGMTESPLIVNPYLRYLTKSELHVIMSSGFATVSGTVLAAYMNFGAEASHLITSSVMAAPATLAFSKLFYPETEVSQTTSKAFTLEKSSETSVLDAASKGAVTGFTLISGIIANLIAFISFIAFCNAIIGWLGVLVGFDFLSIEWFFGKFFIPLSYIMGIPWEECEKVGEIIAAKNIINEFVAYEKLGRLKEAGEISMRSAAITTFAICGFANLSSLGMMIGNLGALCPEKRSSIVDVSVRALIAGSIICFINASIAGLLMTDDMFNTEPNMNFTRS